MLRKVYVNPNYWVTQTECESTKIQIDLHYYSYIPENLVIEVHLKRGTNFKSIIWIPFLWLSLLCRGKGRSQGYVKPLCTLQESKGRQIEEKTKNEFKIP